MALTGPDCAKAVYGQVMMAFPGGNIIEEAPEPIAAALALVAANPPGGVAVAISIRVLGADGLSLNCCPDGYSFDPDARTCKLGPPKPVVVNPPPPAPAPPPPPAPPDPDDDELGGNFTLLFQYLLKLTQEIQNLTGSQNGTAAADCCKAVVLVLSRLLRAVVGIEKVMQQPGAAAPPPVDLSAVITELTCICESSRSGAAAVNSIAQNLPLNLQAIADAITSAKPTDVSQIVEQLKLLYKTIDVPIAVYQDLAKRGLISAELLQVVGSGEFGAGAVSVLVDFVQKALTWVLSWAGVTWNGKKWAVAPLGTTVANDIADAITATLNTGGTPLYPVIRGMVDGIVKVLIPTAPPEIGDIHVDADLIITKTLVPALIMNTVALLFDYLGWEISEQLKYFVDVASEFVGLQEVRELKVGQLMRFGPMRKAEMDAKRVYRQELPGTSELAQLAARGIIPTDRYGQLAPLTGIPAELQGAISEAAETGLQPFILLRLAGTGLFTDRDLVDEMTFRGVRPASQHRILLAAPFVASQKERDALRGTLEKAYAGGLFADVDFTDRINALEQETDRGRLILERAKLERALGVLKEIENAYETEFLAGITDAPTFESKLKGLGLQLDYVTGIMAKAEAHANARLIRQAAAAERALVKATAAEERRAALTQYQAGNTNEAALSAALVATGLTPIQAAAWVAQAVGQRAGKLRLVYGLRLSQAESTLLRQRVADLMKQRELQMLTDNQFVQGLQALKIPPTFVNALRAGANAALKPKTAAILTPVITT